MADWYTDPCRLAGLAAEGFADAKSR